MNQFTGTLPLLWSSLTNLAILSAHANNISGTLPFSWSKLENLESIFVADNNLQGPVPVQWSQRSFWGMGMASLSYIQLAGNAGLCGTLPPQWTSNQSYTVDPAGGGSLTDFYTTVADISGTSIEGSGANNTNCTNPLPPSPPFSPPPPVTDPNSTIAQLLYNAWTPPPSNWTLNADFFNYCLWRGVSCDSSSLPITISLNNESLPGSLPNSWSSITSLKSLVVSSASQLNGSFPPQWSSLTGLTQLVIANAGMMIPLSTYLLPPQWSSLTRLRSLALENCHVSGSVPDGYSMLQSLLSLSVKGNSLSGPLPDLKMMTGLTGLNLGSNNFNGSLPSSYSILKGLKSLLLTSLPKIDSALPPHWSSLMKLTFLDLSNSSGIKGSIPSSWSKGMIALTKLDLNSTSICGTLPPFKSPHSTDSNLSACPSPPPGPPPAPPPRAPKSPRPPPIPPPLPSPSPIPIYRPTTDDYSAARRGVSTWAIILGVLILLTVVGFSALYIMKRGGGMQFRLPGSSSSDRYRDFNDSFRPSDHPSWASPGRPGPSDRLPSLPTSTRRGGSLLEMEHLPRNQY